MFEHVLVVSRLLILLAYVYTKTESMIAFNKKILENFSFCLIC